MRQNSQVYRYIKSYDDISRGNGLEYALRNKSDEEKYPLTGTFDMIQCIEDEIAYGEFNDIKKMEVLEIGIGSGDVINQLYEEGAKVCGIDQSIVMLEIAQSKMPKGEFIQWDVGYSMPPKIKDKKFEYIIAIYSFHNYDNDVKVEIIENLMKHLKEDGKIIIGDVSFSTQEELEQCRKENYSEWDDEDCYIVAEDIIPRLWEKGIKTEYIKVSSCAGVLKTL